MRQCQFRKGLNFGIYEYVELSPKEELRLQNKDEEDSTRVRQPWVNAEQKVSYTRACQVQHGLSTWQGKAPKCGEVGELQGMYCVETSALEGTGDVSSTPGKLNLWWHLECSEPLVGDWSVRQFSPWRHSMLFLLESILTLCGFPFSSTQCFCQNYHLWLCRMPSTLSLYSI